MHPLPRNIDQTLEILKNLLPPENDYVVEPDTQLIAAIGLKKSAYKKLSSAINNMQNNINTLLEKFKTSDNKLSIEREIQKELSSKLTEAYKILVNPKNYVIYINYNLVAPLLENIIRNNSTRKKILEKIKNNTQENQEINIATIDKILTENEYNTYINTIKEILGSIQILLFVLFHEVSHFINNVESYSIIFPETRGEMLNILDDMRINYFLVNNVFGGQYLTPSLFIEEGSSPYFKIITPEEEQMLGVLYKELDEQTFINLLNNKKEAQKIISEYFKKTPLKSKLKLLTIIDKIKKLLPNNKKISSLIDQNPQIVHRILNTIAMMNKPVTTKTITNIISKLKATKIDTSFIYDKVEINNLDNFIEKILDALEIKDPEDMTPKEILKELSTTRVLNAISVITDYITNKDFENLLRTYIITNNSNLDEETKKQLDNNIPNIIKNYIHLATIINEIELKFIFTPMDIDSVTNNYNKNPNTEEEGEGREGEEGGEGGSSSEEEGEEGGEGGSSSEEEGEEGGESEEGEEGENIKKRKIDINKPVKNTKKNNKPKDKVIGYDAVIKKVGDKIVIMSLEEKIKYNNNKNTNTSKNIITEIAYIKKYINLLQNLLETINKDRIIATSTAATIDITDIIDKNTLDKLNKGESISLKDIPPEYVSINQKQDNSNKQSNKKDEINNTSTNIQETMDNIRDTLQDLKDKLKKADIKEKIDIEGIVTNSLEEALNELDKETRDAVKGYGNSLGALNIVIKNIKSDPILAKKLKNLLNKALEEIKKYLQTLIEEIKTIQSIPKGDYDYIKSLTKGIRSIYNYENQKQYTNYSDIKKGDILLPSPADEVYTNIPIKVNKNNLQEKGFELVIFVDISGSMNVYIDAINIIIYTIITEVYTLFKEKLSKYTLTGVKIYPIDIELRLIIDIPENILNKNLSLAEFYHLGYAIPENGGGTSLYDGILIGLIDIFTKELIEKKDTSNTIKTIINILANDKYEKYQKVYATIRDKIYPNTQTIINKNNLNKIDTKTKENNQNNLIKIINQFKNQKEFILSYPFLNHLFLIITDGEIDNIDTKVITNLITGNKVPSNLLSALKIQRADIMMRRKIVALKNMEGVKNLLEGIQKELQNNDNTKVKNAWNMAKIDL